ncbi:MAG TPA: cation diffusion facilitator family transporter [Nitrospira sp.]|nr:cation diffusion facilitator family transporter [Nitrospira sp.]
MSSTKRVIYAALLGNVAVAATKFMASHWTGSSAMFSEAIHSLVDTGNQVLLLYGLRRAAAKPDPEHPLGYGREVYFWSFIVALLVFALGAGGTLYEGIRHIRHPEPIKDPVVNYVVLGLAFIFEGSSWLVSLRQFQSVKGTMGFYEAFRRSKDPPSFMVLFEDTAAIAGLAIAAVGTVSAVLFNEPVLDGVASILIAVLLGSVALLLARESKSLLIGEPAGGTLRRDVIKIAEEEQGIERVNGVLTVQLSPDQVVAAMSVEFTDDLSVPEIERRVIEVERRIRETHPELMMLFVKPQSTKAFEDAAERRFSSDAPADRQAS